MSNYLPCNEYIGEEVVVSYYDEGSQRWITEEARVLEDPYGMILLQSPGPSVGSPYWVGKRFSSTMKTMPIRSPNTLNDKKRIASIHAYIDNSLGGTVEVGTEEGSQSADLSYGSDSPESGKITIPAGSGYGEDPYVKVSTDSIYPLNLLALEIELSRYN